MVRKILFLLLLFFCFNKVSFGQGTLGKDFWLTMMDLADNCPTYPYPYFDTLEVYITSPYAANVTLNSATNQKLKLVPNKATYVNLTDFTTVPYSVDLVCRALDADIYSQNGTHITADSLIQVVAVNRYWQTKGVTTILPTESIPFGPEYIVSTNQSAQSWACYGSQPPVKSGEFAIVGIAPMSKIEVVPMAKSTARYKGTNVPFIINLAAGQTFFYVSGDNDLTGSLIRSKDTFSKFAVFAGNRKSGSIQLASNGKVCTNGDDHAFEQMIPTICWGNSYTALPYKNLKGGYYLKILGSQRNTSVKINGNFYQTINEGEYFIYNLMTDTATRITADRPISVTQFSKGTICGQHTSPKNAMGDLSQLELTPDQQWSTKAVAHKVIHLPKYWGSSSSWHAPEDYVNVIVKSTDTSAFTINGKKLPNKQWKSSSLMNGYQYAQIYLDSSYNYNLNCAGGLAAYVYGYGSNEGYAYSAGASFRHLNNNFVYNNLCQRTKTMFTALEKDSFSNYSWRFGDNSSKDTGRKVFHTYKDTGWFNVVMYSKNIYTNVVDSLQKRIHMAPAGSVKLLFNDTLVCGPIHIPYFLKNFDTDNTYLWNNGHPNYYFQFDNPGQYWVKMKERNECLSFDTVNITTAPFPVASFSLSDTLFCANRSKAITFNNLSTSIDSIAQQQWDFGDLNVNDTHKIVKHIYKKADLYYVSLKITTVKGCVDDTFKLVKVLKSPEANFTINATDSCFGSNKVLFTNTTVIDSTVHQRYKWHFSDSFVISNGDPVGPRSFSIAGDNYAELIYENFNGCIDTMKKFIRIYSLPKPSFSFKSNFSCTSDSIRIVNKTISQYQPVKSAWDFGDGKKDTAFNPVHYYVKKGTYDVKLIARIPQGCKDSIVLPITVYGSPKADIAINNVNQCLKGNQFIFVNSSTTDTGGLPLRKWTFSDGSIELNKDTAIRTFGVAGDYNVKLKVTGIFGCSDSVIKVVHVKNAPFPVFTFNKSSQCFNAQNFNFTYNPQTGNDSISKISWYFNRDSLKNVISVTNIKFPFTGSYPITLKLVSKYGCEAESVQSAFVNPNPVAKFKVPKTIQCLTGNAFTVVHYSTVNTGKVSGFYWDYGDLTSSVLEFPVPKTYGKSGQYKILLTATSDSGCTDTFSSLVNVRASAIITINPVPQVCLNDTASMNGSATITDGFIRKYQWEFGDNAKTDTIVSPAVRHLYQNVGSYFVKLSTISNYGCVDSKTEYNWVTVNALPNAAFGYYINDGGQHNSIVNFKDLTQPPAFSLRWNFGKYGTSRKSDTALSIIDTTTIHAKLYVTDSKGCTGMIEKIIFVAPPGEMYFPTAFTANGDGINDGFGPVGIAFATNYKFTIYNRWGEMVYKSTKLGETWDGYYDGSLSQNGVYIYKLELNDFYGQFKSYEGSFLLLW